MALDLRPALGGCAALLLVLALYLAFMLHTGAGFAGPFSDPWGYPLWEVAFWVLVVAAAVVGSFVLFRAAFRQEPTGDAKSRPSRPALRGSGFVLVFLALVAAISGIAGRSPVSILIGLSVGLVGWTLIRSNRSPPDEPIE